MDRDARSSSFGAPQVADAKLRAVALGHEAEAHVARALTQAGWSVIARRWQGGGAELDLVVSRGAALRFVEVKARTDAALDPLESIGRSKQTRLARAAEVWLAKHVGDWDDVAFLVAVVTPGEAGFEVAWIDDAFDGV